MQPEVIGGRYRVGSAIGQGGMGTVWLCRDELLRRDVAVKQVGLLPGESVTDSARALREARSSAALSHRNVVTVFDVVEQDDAIWLVMEYLPSRSLSQLIKAEGPLAPARVAEIGAQVADGLAAAHASGTIHRDVKPGNVLVGDNGIAKISDFGIARTAGDPTLTGSGLLTGTPAYFSPELARGAAPGPPSDVWALGGTLYAAVEGRPPYRLQDNPVAMLHDIASNQPPAPRRAGFLEPVLVRMMDRDPSSRWSMADAAHSLHRLAVDHAPERTRSVTLGTGWSPEADRPRGSTPARTPAPASHHTPEQPAGGPPEDAARDAAKGASGVRSRSGRRGTYAAVAAVVLLLVVAGLGYALARGGGGSPSHQSARSHSPSSTSSTTASRTSPSSGTSPTPTTTASSSSSATASSTGTGAPASGGLSAKTAFLKSYFKAVPGGTDKAWAELTPSYQRSIGRGSFDGFWRTISSVTVSDVVPAGGSSVEATLTYHTTDGRKSTERHRITLVRSGNGYLIGGDAPV